jgi:hypothetical protein
LNVGLLVLDEVIHASEKKLNIENLIPILIQRKSAPRPEWSYFCKFRRGEKLWEIYKKAGTEGGNVRHKKIKTTHSTKSNWRPNKNKKMSDE